MLFRLLWLTDKFIGHSHEGDFFFNYEKNTAKCLILPPSEGEDVLKRLIFELGNRKGWRGGKHSLKEELLEIIAFSYKRCKTKHMYNLRMTS